MTSMYKTKHKVSKETREKISKSLTGKKLSKAHRLKLRMAKLGKKRGPMTEQHKRRIGRANRGKTPWCKGKKMSKKFCDKISSALKGKYKREKSSTWKGGKYIDGNGYSWVFRSEEDERHFQEHRLVVSKHLGRDLLTSEIVHHLGAKSDNRLHMLMLFKSNSAHRNFECGKEVPEEDIIFDGRKLAQHK